MVEVWGCAGSEAEGGCPTPAPSEDAEREGEGPWCEAVWTGRKGSGMKLLVLR